MAKVFEVKADLPASTRQEIERIQAINSGNRTTAEAANTVADANWCRISLGSAY